MKTRIILYTGKGGVGKTSVAASTARGCAAAGLRTLVMSTDPAHSLSESLSVKLGGEPVRVLAHQNHSCCWEAPWPSVLSGAL